MDIRSNHGGSFVNKELKQFYSEEGIEMQLKAEYSSDYNGVEERRNCFLHEMTICMLLDAGLEKQYWEEAAAAFAYVHPESIVELHSSQNSIRAMEWPEIGR